jgi:hypothetical protein
MSATFIWNLLRCQENGTIRKKAGASFSFLHMACGLSMLLILVLHTSIVVEDKNGGGRKGYPILDQTFHAEFNELLCISIVLKLNGLRGN